MPYGGSTPPRPTMTMKEWIEIFKMPKEEADKVLAKYVAKVRAETEAAGKKWVESLDNDLHLQ